MMPRNLRKTAGCALALTMTISAACVAAPDLPEPLPADRLAPGKHPLFFVTPEQLEVASGFITATDRGRRYLEAQKERAARFAAMDEGALRALVPPPNCLITYGLGMNLDPIHREPFEWAGWEDPFRVRARDGRLYPNDEWPDEGDGIQQPETGERFYFRALAHGRIFQELELRILPALADVAALTGSHEHARAAAILLDAIAEVYPTNRRGPMDYPTQPGDLDRGGRLDRPYYQVARGLYNYARVIDLIAPSGELEKPSAAAPGLSIREHVGRNLLWDGGLYCYEFAAEGYHLHNGHADYLRGAALAGLMLDVRELAEPIVSGHASFFRMLQNNLDRNGFYYETAPHYAAHTRSLYFTMADVVERMRRRGWTDVPSPYDRADFHQFLLEPFNRREIGGHVPLVGDSGPDRYQSDPARRRPGGGVSPLITAQVRSNWIRLVLGIEAGSAAAALRRDLGDNFAPLNQTWFIYNIGPDEIASVAAAEPEVLPEPVPVFYGAKGLALLRGGKQSLRHGAQLFFGPINNHGQSETLTWTFFARGAEWSYDPGYFNTHYRMGWTSQSVAHQALVVDETSFDWAEGGGYLAAWSDAPDVQFAHAVHPDAYASRDVSRYERIIGQIQNPDTDDAGYWLDIGRVAGGQRRDDSFHTQHQDVEIDLPLKATGAASLHGDINFGKIIGGDYRLEGFGEEGFYWMPPGHGYGFLGDPREAEQPDVARAVFTQPAFASDAVMIADLSGAPGRRLVLADGPSAPNSPAVPYLLRRDEGNRPSVFAKLLRLADSLEEDPILSFSEIALETSGGASPSPFATAWKLTWKNGRRDIWIFCDGESVATARQDVLPRITTDAAVAFLRFDATGDCQRIEASGAGFVGIGTGRHAADFAPATATVRKIDWEHEEALRLEVDWEDGVAPAAIPPGTLVVNHPSHGQPSSWMARALEDGSVIFEDRHAIIARTDLTAGEDGWHRLESSVSRFIAAFSQPNHGFAVGKAVYSDQKYVGRIAELSEDVRSVRLDAGGQEIDLPNSFSAVIAEIAPGDRLEIPGRVSWRKEDLPETPLP